MSQIALLFPGQGSQQVGMGRDLYERYAEARSVFDEADHILDFSLSHLCFEGPKDRLDDTINTQPALFTVSLALWRVLSAHGNVPDVSFVAGHSMGEYSALAVAGALSFAGGLRLVRERGRLMKQAGKQNPGGMAAILGLADDLVAEVCEQASAQADGPGVQVANYNCPGQVVISGGKAAVREAGELARRRGARRVVPLDVSIAAHSSLMSPIVETFAEAVRQANVQTPAIPVVANITAQPLQDVDSLRRELVGQLKSSVQWTRSVQEMIARGTTTFVEIGPGNVLRGLLRRIDRSATCISINDGDGIEAFVRGL
ncbi:MAG: ACP S-malonyltransferase [Chloroflexi bacterium]|nr:ACP S-malonyltransferase [Chloroflexota bacterium]